jgi:hypothetical protein
MRPDQLPDTLGRQAIPERTVEIHKGAAGLVAPIVPHTFAANQGKV